MRAHRWSRLRPRRECDRMRRGQEGGLGPALRLLQQHALSGRLDRAPGDNTTGEGEGDDEVINVDLAAIPPAITNIVLSGVDLRRRRPRRRVSARCSNAFIRIVDRSNGNELARYDLSEDASTETAMVFGELYRNGAEWKFRAIGQGYASGLSWHRPRLRRQRLSRCPRPSALAGGPLPSTDREFDRVVRSHLRNLTRGHRRRPWWWPSSTAVSRRLFSAPCSAYSKCRCPSTTPLSTPRCCAE